MSFLNWCKNHVKYKFFRFLFYLIIAILLGYLSSFAFITPVKAEVANFNVFWRNSVPSEIIQYSDNSVWSGVTNTINQQSTFQPYLTIYMCETGYVDVSNIQNVKGKLNFVSKGNTQNQCKLSNGFGGHLQYYVFFISDYDTSSGAYMTNVWKMDIKSTVNYNNFQQILGISTSDNASSISDYYSILDQLWYQLEDLKTASNSSQQGINNLQSSINALEDNVISNQKETNAKLDEAEKTRKGIWETIKDLPNAFLNMLKSLIIPENFDFINDFKDALENKLGFIASIPLQLINFLLNLTTASWQDVTSVSLPNIEIFGYNWWNGGEIDISEGIRMFSAVKYLTDVLCVIIMANTLLKWWQSITGGGEK